MPKRKSPHADDADAPAPRRSTRQRTSTATMTTAPTSPSSPASKRKGADTAEAKAKKPVKANPRGQKAPRVTPKAKTVTNGVGVKKQEVPKPAEEEEGGSEAGDEAGSSRQYWLMKAEPEPRFENGVNVSFSIDDLKAKTEPEPWDGIRNYVARNNLRAMKKGDLAFFSHSNCKEPGIVGIMEIVQEHSPDLSAHDPKSAYYDAKSSPSDPRWSVVHVEFRRKFAAPVTLKEMRTMTGAGGPLEKMQMMKQSRLSVSRVSEKEWEHLMEVAEGKEKEAAK